MKTLFVVVFGLLIGAAAAGAVLYYNPMTESAAAAPGATDRVLRYSLPDQVLELALGNKASLLGHSTGDDVLWEETIDGTALLGLVLNDEANQPVGVASRLMAASPDTDLLLRGVLVSDYWLVTLPREGTLFVRADSNVWPFLKQTLVPVWYLERPWHGPVEYRPTVGPGSDNTAEVIGIAGAFTERDGSAVERYNVTTLDPVNRSAAAEGELFLHLPAPQVAVQQ
jgi:hypothetical protein